MSTELKNTENYTPRTIISFEEYKGGSSRKINEMGVLECISRLQGRNHKIIPIATCIAFENIIPACYRAGEKIYGILLALRIMILSHFQENGWNDSSPY